MHRRQAISLLSAGALSALGGLRGSPSIHEAFFASATHSVVPVVGDGRWTWLKPPAEERGYLEPRSYRLKVGVQWEGTGSSSLLRGTTPVPVEYPEQKLVSMRLDADGCEAQVRKINEGAAELLVVAHALSSGQKVSAIVEYELELRKQYHAYAADQFPREQKIPTDVRRQYLQDSPGIETSSKAVRALAQELKQGQEYPWDQAYAFFNWVRKNIQPQLGPYTSVTTALNTQRGDCEEMAGVFVALCRAVNIPARLVWVPNHAWGEFYLSDREGKGHWIPAHTACYLWFGFTGAYELVLQKGDRVQMPERRKQLRLMEDWMQWSGAKPRVRYAAELTPLPPKEGDDPGPGGRQKDEQGKWHLLGDHPLNKYTRP